MNTDNHADSNNPYSSPRTENAEPVSENSLIYVAKKRRIVILLLAYSAISGVLFCFFPDKDTTLDFLFGLPILILGITWCFTDADELNHRIGRTMKVALVFVFVVSFPFYLLQTRGFGAFKTFAFVLLLVGAMFTCMCVTALVTASIGVAIGLWEFADLF